MYINGSKARKFITQYNTVPYRTIHDCYARPSQNKIAAWAYCIIKCREMNGRYLTVLSYCTTNFTAAFEYTNPDTGVLMLHVETYENSYDMEM